MSSFNPNYISDAANTDNAYSASEYSTNKDDNAPPKDSQGQQNRCSGRDAVKNVLALTAGQVKKLLRRLPTKANREAAARRKTQAFLERRRRDQHGEASSLCLRKAFEQQRHQEQEGEAWWCAWAMTFEERRRQDQKGEAWW